MPQIELNGEQVAFETGDTIFEVAAKQGQSIPSLCYDKRLKGFGSCRLCAVELDGSRNPVASCTTEAKDGMVVRSHSDELEQMRKTLVEMVCSENPAGKVDPLAGYASQELQSLAENYVIDNQRFKGKKSGQTKADDNPFILRDYDRCISCYRCVRVCDEQEGDFAISMMGRGFDTQITTEFNGDLKDSACTFCGQCVQTCPTGALADKKALRYADIEAPIEKTRTICTYCGVGCSIDVMTKNETIVGVQPAMDGPANEGALCVKGQFAYDFVQHRDRLTTPLLRGQDGKLHPASWDDALDAAAAGFRKAWDEHGRYSTYAIASGRAPHEAAYSVQKFIRSGTASHYVDNCSRG